MILCYYDRGIRRRRRLLCLLLLAAFAVFVTVAAVSGMLHKNDVMHRLTSDECICGPDVPIPSARGLHPASHVFVMGIRSHQAYQMTIDYLNAGHNVTFLAFSPIPPTLLSDVPVLQHAQTRGRLKFMRGPGICRPEIFKWVFSENVIKEVHVVFEADDFPSISSPRELGAAMKCYVGLLQNLSLYKNISIYVYLSIQSGGNVPFVSRHVVPEVVPPSARRAGVTSDFRHGQSETGNGRTGSNGTRLVFESNKCDLHFEYKSFHEVFLKQIELYSRTFQNLHGLAVHFILIDN